MAILVKCPTMQANKLWCHCLYSRHAIVCNQLAFFRTLTSNSQSSLIKPRRVTVIGGGSWGTAMCKVIADNVVKYPQLLDPEVVLYLRDDNLRVIIEKTRVNLKYLLKIKLPTNIRPISDLNKAISRSDILVFAVPHEYIEDVCYQISQKSIPTSKPIAISLVKGLHINREGNIERTTEIINRMLKIKCGVLSGANVAIEVAREQFSEATLSPPVYHDPELDDMLIALFQASYFKISLVYDTSTVEICGALKNVIALGAGIIDGIGLGINTKAAAIKKGILESISFVAHFEPSFNLSTFLENCGIADVIASSFGGRNRRVIEEFVKTNKPLAILEKEILAGQKLQGPNTAAVVYQLLVNKNLVDQFPFFIAIYRICFEGEKPETILKALVKH